MDPGSAAAGPLSALGDFPNLRAARSRTAAGLGLYAERLAALPLDRGTSVVLMGSWGRREVTDGSDTDWLVVADGAAATRPSAADVRAVLGAATGTRELFNDRVEVGALTRIGAGDDDGLNLTRRLLLLIESVPVLGAGVHRAALRSLLDAYLAGERRDRRPPRFLLNDLIRYWRTIAVEFEAKGERKWALRHAKLRTSRTVLFAGGLLPVLECHHVIADEVGPLLLERFSEPPVDRLARAFATYDAMDAGARALGAYDRFLGLLDDPERRLRLEDLPREEADTDPTFQEARRLGREVQQGLLALLFEREPLRRLVRQYGVF